MENRYHKIESRTEHEGIRSSMRDQAQHEESAFKKSIRGAALGIAGLAAVAASGCATLGGPDQQAGTVIGGVLGGVLGNNIGQGYGREAATIFGAILGSEIGGAIGKSMDRQDSAIAANAIINNQNGETTSWANPNTGNSYRVTPVNTYPASNGQICRQYVTTGFVGSQAETIKGTACRQPDGSWKIVN